MTKLAGYVRRRVRGPSTDLDGPAAVCGGVGHVADRVVARHVEVGGRRLGRPGRYCNTERFKIWLESLLNIMTDSISTGTL
jgi:hypothetical protein